MSNEKEYLKSLGLKSIDEAYELVKRHCFTTVESPTKGDVQLVLAACVVNNLDPRFNEIYAGYDSFNQVIPVLKIRGWERLADQSNRIKGVEFVYSDNSVNVQGSSLTGCEWVECHVYVDTNDHPITSRVWLLERIELGHSWLTMPNMRLEQSAYTAAVRRALGVRGLHDIDETTLADVMQMGKPSSIEDTSEDKGLAHLVTEEPEPETPTVDQEAIDRLNAKLQMMEIELQAIEPDTVEYFNARSEIAKVKVSIKALLGNDASTHSAPDFPEPEPEPYPEDDELSNNDALVVSEQAPPKGINYKPSQKDKTLLNQYCMYLQSSGLTAIVDRVNDSPELTKPGQREWLIDQLTEKAAELNAA